MNWGYCMKKTEKSILYKYYPPEEYVFEALTQGTICFTDLYSQNDPFEAMGFYRNTPGSKPSIPAESELQKTISQYITEEDRNFLRNECRIFCSTTECNRPLMWAHYARSHSGICVGYDYQDIQKYCDILKPVKYLTVPLEKDISYDHPERFLLLKATDWRYEKEIRGIYTIKSQDCRITDTLTEYSACETDYDEKYLFFAKPNDRIGESVRALRRIIKKCEPREIILGICTSAEIEQRVQTICREKHIPLYKAQQKENTFEVLRVRIM